MMKSGLSIFLSFSLFYFISFLPSCSFVFLPSQQGRTTHQTSFARHVQLNWIAAVAGARKPSMQDSTPDGQAPRADGSGVIHQGGVRASEGKLLSPPLRLGGRDGVIVLHHIRDKAYRARRVHGAVPGFQRPRFAKLQPSKSEG